MGEVSTIGIDLAKSVFQVHGGDASGAVLFRRKLRRQFCCSFDGSPARAMAVRALGRGSW
jgi:hypothetical protein